MKGLVSPPQLHEWKCLSLIGSHYSANGDSVRSLLRYHDEKEGFAPMTRSRLCSGVPSLSHSGSIQCTHRPQKVSVLEDWCTLVRRRYEKGWRSRRLWCCPYTDIVIHTLPNEVPDCAPFCVYSMDASEESQRCGNQSMWDTVYPVPRRVETGSGLYQTMRLDALVNMEFDEEGEMPDESRRAPMDWHRYYLCPVYTPHSTAAGVTRSLCKGCRVRLRTDSLLKSLNRVLNACVNGSDDSTESNSTGAWDLWCDGLVTQVSDTVVGRVLSALRSESISSYQCPTAFIRQEHRLLVINVSPGVVMRKIGGYWRDTNTMWDEETRHAMELPLTVMSSVEDLTSFMPSTVPYIKFDEPPRPLVASNHCLQAVCAPYLDSQSVIRPLHYSNPLVLTRSTALIMKAYEEGDLDCALPGMNLRVLYLNLGDGYEDAIIVSEKYAKEGHFDIEVKSLHTLPMSVERVKNGDTITREKHSWWKIPVPGVVESQTVKDLANGYMVHTTRQQSLVSGDKIATLHGQKGVVILWSESRMPIGVDGDKRLEFDAIVSTSSITNRSTAGQVMESGMGLKMQTEGKTIVVGDHDVYRDTPTCNVWTSHGCVMRTKVPSGKYERTRATYGVARFLRLTQIVYDKWHYTHDIAGRNTAKLPTGRTRGGPIRLGEMEFVALYANMPREIVADLSDRRSVVVAKICTKCKRSAWLCTCGSDKSWASTKIPYNLLQYDCALALTQSRSIQFVIE